MKHIFVLNPAAGNGRAERALLPEIVSACKAHQLHYEIHRTLNVGEATAFVRRSCREATDEDCLRFYAIGGDGTIGEVATGLWNAENAELAALPCGSGNDFCRQLGSEKVMRNVENQLFGQAVPMDVLRVNDRICVNMINIGLDGTTAAEQVKIKATTAWTGTASYVAALLPQLVKMEPAHLHITLEDGTCLKGAYTLCTIGNGSCCGGGFRAMPKARIDDGVMDISLVPAIDRKTFLRLVVPYARGKHMENKFVQKNELLQYLRARKVLIHTDGRTPVCIDGEIVYAEELAVEVLPAAVRLVIPKGASL